ncbi:enoyl-CoA hydratase/isomerase family protein [Streptomyces turgidiscabies]|uniref:Enoyl-CoA hydratase/isomerase family protein n=1 Tax=Streptomyces turgidiscabies (strain Car8) TaxID=698760 RepID=L7EVR5_STRT8|nr:MULTISPECIES: enoyl-CoA hydratase-related protein [Streptomyces]ELP63513.1 enoyl-CoA hydratase/isomerase family protein [Streptomyces turgidiscabies Car8]MDX3496243.1 enoyl-CoA hydratase-related protein [Streptomyces turgidiscabies]GAQ75261.1 1,2-epoxyphenylacetyl-CoA isomerase [Streptomyces turgidiscabies]
MRVTVEVDGDGLARVEMCRGAGNAIDLAMARGLLDAARECEKARARAVLLTGRGRSFCVGGDLKEFATLSGERLAAHLTDVTDALHGALRILAGLDAPLVAAVQGAVAGAGLGLATAADVSLAASDARFTAAYTAIGYTPDAGTSWSLPRLVGPRRAMDLLLTNRRVPAPEALEMGLVSRVVEPERLYEEAVEVAGALARGATRAYGVSRRLVDGALSVGLGEHLDAEARQLAAAAVSAEGREGVAAFLAGRRPHFAHPDHARPESARADGEHGTRSVVDSKPT